MTRVVLFMAILLAPTGLVYAEAPDPGTIQQAMNEGFELEFPYFQEIADVQIVRGGAIDENEYLFLCGARLVWKLGSAEFSAIMQQEIDEEVASNGNDETLWRTLHIVLAEKLERIGEFAQGDTILTVRFRVRLEQAGTDWIVTDARIKDSDRNPLYIIDKGSP